MSVPKLRQFDREHDEAGRQTMTCTVRYDHEIIWKRKPWIMTTIYIFLNNSSIGWKTQIGSAEGCGKLLDLKLHKLT